MARGWYARGQIAEGLVAVGQLARGHFAVGQLAIGKFFAVGQAAFAGLVAVGMAALGGLLGIGQFGAGLVAAGVVALGVLVAAVHGVDPGALPILVVAAALLLPAALLGIFGLRSWLHRTETRVLEEEIALAEGQRSPRADERSLSRSDPDQPPRADGRSLSVSPHNSDDEEELSSQEPERLTETREENSSLRPSVDA